MKQRQQRNKGRLFFANQSLEFFSCYLRTGGISGLMHFCTPKSQPTPAKCKRQQRQHSSLCTPKYAQLKNETSYQSLPITALTQMLAHGASAPQQYYPASTQSEQSGIAFPSPKQPEPQAMRP